MRPRAVLKQFSWMSSRYKQKHSTQKAEGARCVVSNGQVGDSGISQPHGAGRKKRSRGREMRVGSKEAGDAREAARQVFQGSPRLALLFSGASSVANKMPRLRFVISSCVMQARRGFSSSSSHREVLLVLPVTKSVVVRKSQLKVTAPFRIRVSMLFCIMSENHPFSQYP